MHQHKILSKICIIIWFTAIGFFAVGLFAVGQFTVKKKKPNLIWPKLTGTNFFFYGEVTHGEKSGHDDLHIMQIDICALIRIIYSYNQVMMIID